MPSGSARARPENAGPAYSATTKLRMWIAVAVASIVTSGLAPTGAAEAADGHTVFRPYGTPGGLQGRVRAAGRPAPAHHQAGHDRRVPPGAGHRRPEGVQGGRAGCGTGIGRRCSTSARSTRASGSLRRWSAGSRTTSSTATAPTRRSPSWSNPPNCGSSRSPTPTAMTTASAPATETGARTCGTTTATAASTWATASTSTATSARSGSTTTKERRPHSAARPSGGRARRLSPRPGRSTA